MTKCRLDGVRSNGADIDAVVAEIEGRLGRGEGWLAAAPADTDVAAVQSPAAERDEQRGIVVGWREDAGALAFPAAVPHHLCARLRWWLKAAALRVPRHR